MLSKEAILALPRKGPKARVRKRQERECRSLETVGLPARGSEKCWVSEKVIAHTYAERPRGGVGIRRAPRDPEKLH